MIDNVCILRGNIIRVVRNLSTHGPFQLVLAGWLFDYLTDGACVRVPRCLYEALAGGGTFLFTNIAEGNYFRPWMEYGSWK